MPSTEQDNDRREFLKACGRFAAVTPPAMTILLSTSLTSDAIARSGGDGTHNGKRGWGSGGDRHHGNNGWGNGGGDGSPNGKDDQRR